MKFSLDQWVETDINGISIRQVKCADCGTEESADQREYNLDCQCGGSFKSVMLRMTTIKQGQIIDYLIDDDDEEYCIQFNDREILWVAGVALRPIETPAAPDAVTPHPAEEFLNEG